MSQSPALQLTMPACTALVWLPGWKTLPILSVCLSSRRKPSIICSSLSAINQNCKARAYALGPCNNPIASLHCPHTTCSERPAKLQSTLTACTADRLCCRQSHTGCFSGFKLFQRTF
ncbi:hypothetical protein GGI42DRAFT_92323 [Trichoderma sp. SZMC 28013]